MPVFRLSDPRLQAVIEKKSQRNLLDPDDSGPLLVELTCGQASRIALEVVNGPEDMIDLSIAADQNWMEPHTTRMNMHSGKSRECIVMVKPTGAGGFGKLMFSWEGSKSTLSHVLTIACQPNFVGDWKSSDHTISNERLYKLVSFMHGESGALIDWEDEQEINRRFASYGMTATQIEYFLLRICVMHQCVREKRIRDTLEFLLTEMIKIEGIVDKQEFERAVAFAMNRGMPRREALEMCVSIMLGDHRKIDDSLSGNMINQYRKQFGL